MVERSGWRGTARGIREALQTFELSSIEIEDSGGTVVSTKPTDPTTWPDVAPPTAKITCVAGPNASIDDDQLTSIVRFLVPAHVIVTLVAT